MTVAPAGLRPLHPPLLLCQVVNQLGHGKHDYGTCSEPVHCEALLVAEDTNVGAELATIRHTWRRK